jgi:polar amino acid transport system substrate-binding protein
VASTDAVTAPEQAGPPEEIKAIPVRHRGRWVVAALVLFLLVVIVHSVAVERGTTQADDATAQDGKCKKAGKPGVKVAVFPDQNGANLALASGREQVGMADSPVAAYIVKKSNGQFKVTGKPYGTAPYGIAIPKQSGLAKPVLAALKKLMANGKYKAILTKWGVQAGAITNPKINGAIS